MLKKSPALRIAILAICCMMMLLLASCNNKKVVTDYGIDNVYYAEDNNREYLFTISGNTFQLTGLNGIQRGTFTYEDNNLALTFSEGDTTTASATLENDVLRLTYNGSAYRFLVKKSFQVRYMDGSVEIQTAAVQNGASAVKPADPKKDGYVFINWYADAAFNTPYTFDTVITADANVYARFEKLTAGVAEHTVSFACEGMTFDALRTINGKALNLPTPVKDGAEFAGWWVSDYQSADKLTYRYTNQVLTQDVTLFAVFKADGAPNVSVNADGITWNALGAGSNYRVTIACGDETIAQSSVGATEFAFDFSKQAAGDYVITVEANGKTTTAYYKNMALDRASGFRVVSSNVLVFSPVENAEKYLITVICGNKSHNHVNVDNGNSTNFNFANCDMPAGGIKFVVTAIADGYMDSISETYTVSRTLNPVTGIVVDDQKITWAPVADALSYNVEISTNGIDYASTLVENTAIAIDGYNAGQLFVRVTPISEGYYSEASEVVTYTKKTLATPTGITLSGSKLVWNRVENATGYSIVFNGKTYSSVECELALTDEMLEAGKTAFDVTVQALAQEAVANSSVSDAALINYATMGNVYYKNGYIYWDPVIGAAYYEITINGRAVTIPAKNNKYAVTFEKAGENVISVRFLDKGNEASPKTTINVTTYLVELDVRGGNAVSNLYIALGDDIHLPVSARDGYSFAGWYTTPNAVNNNGRQFGQTTLHAATDLILYADWSAKTYQVTLNAGNGACDILTKNVLYGQFNVLPVPTVPTETTVFAGWFSQENGKGIRYSNELGEALFAWNSLEDIPLYAYYAEVLSFDLIAGGKQYAVSAGAFGIGSLAEITIPATYNDLPVTTIEASAFAGCSSLEVINIPNTVTNIELGINGIYNSGSAFYSCGKMTAINIYEVEGVKAPRYFSDDGVLYCNNEFNGVEIKAVPYAKAGILTIKEGTTTIPTRAFGSTKLTEIYVPYTVTQVDMYGFYLSSRLTKIAFLDVPEGATAQPLHLAEGAIANNEALTTLILPSRLENLTTAAFDLIPSLTDISISGENGNYTVKGEPHKTVLCNADGSTILYCPKGVSGEFTIPAGVTSIGEEAFLYCLGITKLTIPGQVTSIGKNAFKGCTHISGINFEENGEPLTVGEGAFYGCIGLTDITIPSGLVKMDKYAFGGIADLVTVRVNAKGANGNLDIATGAFGSTAEIPTFSVRDVYLGKDVPIFGISAAFGQKLENIYVDKDNENYADVNGILYNKAITAILFYPMNRQGAYVTPETLTTIGANVFSDRTGLTSITIGKNVASIEESAFSDCTALSEVVFESGRTAALTIGNRAFAGCEKLAALNLPEGLTTIGNEAFSGLSKIITLVIPEGVTTIGKGAFSNCPLLTTVSLPSTLTTFELSDGTAFSGDDELVAITVANNEKFIVDGGILYVKENGKETIVAFCPVNAGDKNVVIPGSVREIYPRAFYNNHNVETVTFEALEAGNTMLTVGEGAFGNVINLKRITLPSGLSTIGKRMFFGCATLEEIVIPNTVASIESEAFSGCSALKALNFEEGGTVELVIGTPKVTQAALSPFFGCKSLKVVTFPERMTVLNAYAFSGKSQAEPGYVEIVNFPSTLKRICQCAFAYATKLTTVNFADNTNLEDADTSANAGISLNSFVYTTSLKEIRLPDSDKTKYTIGSAVFQNSGLSALYIPKAVKTISAAAFQNCYSLKKVVFQDGASPTLQGGGTFTNATSLEELELSEGMTQLLASMFSGCSNLKRVVIPSTVTQIMATAFQNCSSLEEVVFATYTSEKDGKQYSKLTTIMNGAFTGCAVKEIVLPNHETGKIQLQTNAFKGCQELERVVLSKSVSGIAGGVFAGCNSIKEFVIEEGAPFYFDTVNHLLLDDKKTSILFVQKEINGEFRIPKGITTIPDNTFEFLPGLTKVIIPKSVKTIGSKAFQYCPMLTEVIFEDSVDEPSQLTSLGTYLFDHCVSLETVRLPMNAKSFKAIPTNTFQYCSSMKSIDLPSTVTSIGNHAFRATGLEKITIPASVNSIGQYAFAGESDELPGALTEITFGKNDAGAYGTLSINTFAFQWQKLKKLFIPNTLSFSTNTNIFAYNRELTEVVFEGGSTIGTIPNYFLAYCPKLTSIQIPKSVTTIGQYTFQGDTGLKNVTFEDNAAVLQNVNLGAFTGCTSLVTLELPNSVSFIGPRAFEGCTALKEFTVPTSVKHLNHNATQASTYSSNGYQFSGCTSLEKVTLPSGLLSICTYVFQNCKSLKEINIPESVTLIGNNAFENCTALKTVNFEGNSALKILGKNVFKNSGIESIAIPAGVTVLGDTGTDATPTGDASTFAGCKSLRNVTFLGKLTKTGANVFKDCTALESITFSENFTQIGANAFQNCKSLTTIVIPGKVATIGANAFDGCSGLTSVTFDKGVNTAIGNATFKGCSSLVSIDFAGRVNKLPDEIFFGCAKLAAFNANGMISIGSGAFEGCSDLTGITLTANAASVGSRAFANSGLTSFTIPEELVSLSRDAFDGCGDLATIHVNAANTTFKEKDGCVYYTANNTIFFLAKNTAGGIYRMTNDNLLGNYALAGRTDITEVIVEEGVTAIPAYAFAGSSVTAVTLPKSLVEIGENAFAGSAITSVVIPKNVTVIANNAFDGCASLTSITFEEGSALSVLAPYAFAGTAIESITLPEGITALGATKDAKTGAWIASETAESHLFEGCANLTSITFKGVVKSINPFTFKKCGKLDYNIPSTILFIGESAFEGTGITSLTVIESMTTIEKAAFKNCAKLASVTFAGNNVKVIGESAFQGCTALTSIAIPAAVERLGNYAFQGCSALKAITFAEDSAMTVFGTYLFQNCTSLESIVVPNGVKEFYENTTGIADSQASYTFDGCTSLKSVILPAGFQSINAYAFQNCKSLEHIDISSVTRLANHAFVGAGLVDIRIPGTLTYTTFIGTQVFMNCAKLETVYMEDGIATLPKETFSGCTALKSIRLPANLVQVAADAFKNCTSLTKIVLPRYTYLSASAFSGWTSEQTIYAVTSERSMRSVSNSSAGWVAAWKDNCDAKVVYGYVEEE